MSPNRTYDPYLSVVTQRLQTSTIQQWYCTVDSVQQYSMASYLASRSRGVHVRWIPPTQNSVARMDEPHSVATDFCFSIGYGM